MTKLELLNDKIEQNKIIKLYYKLPPGRKGMTIEIKKDYGIFIDKSQFENPDEEFCTTVHEYGHCMTGSTHKIYSKYELISRHEYRANKKAILDFLPKKKIKEAIKHGCTELWELSEYLDLPQPFVEKAIELYKVIS